MVDDNNKIIGELDDLGGLDELDELDDLSEAIFTEVEIQEETTPSPVEPEIPSPAEPEIPSPAEPEIPSPAAPSPEDTRGFDGNTQKAKAPKEFPDGCTVLYILSDRTKEGQVQYFRDCGVKVSRLFYSVTDLRNSLIMQRHPCRMVIVDSGTGVFSATGVRKEILDMLGAVDDNKKATVIFTDSAIKEDASAELGALYKKITWIRYTTTVAIVGNILKAGEKYEYLNPEQPSTGKKNLDTLKFRGAESNRVTEERMPEVFKTEDIVEKILGAKDESSLLETFKVAI